VERLRVMDAMRNSKAVCVEERLRALYGLVEQHASVALAQRRVRPREAEIAIARQCKQMVEG